MKKSFYIEEKQKNKIKQFGHFHLITTAQKTNDARKIKPI
jgi:hypothetical protein